MGTTTWMIRYVSFDLYTETDIETYADCHPAKFIYALEQKGFKITPNTLVGVGWSHKEAYDFFKGCKSKTIYNFDAHHDCGYGPKKELDCGNWLEKLYKATKVKVIQVYPKWRDVKESKPQIKIKKQTFQSINIKPIEVEALYLAQSPAWVPPHFDEHFLFMVSCISNRTKKQLIDYDKGYAQRKAPSIEEARKVYNEQQRATAKLNRKGTNHGV